MEMIAEDLERLLQGKAPATAAGLEAVTAGLDPLTDFLEEQYLSSYIPEGGSKIKFVTGRPGSGKTHLAEVIRARAERLGYRTAWLSAKEVSLHDFRGIYLEILRQADLEAVLEGCADKIVRDMGYDPGDIGQGKRFMDLLAEHGEGDALSKSEIRGALRAMFTRNPLLDNCFAACCSLLTGDLLGHPALEKTSRESILAFLRGDKSVKPSQMRALGVSPSPVTKYNARHLLRSLAEVVSLSGRPGLMVVVDDMETLLKRGKEEPIRYTKLRREDTYESVRQLIDDIDSMRHAIFFLSFDRALMDQERYGLKSYQALWLRIQNEVISQRFNRFADIIDLDRYADEFYGEDVLLDMSRRLAEVLQIAEMPAGALTPEGVREIAEKSRHGGVGLPYMVNRAVVEGGRENV